MGEIKDSCMSESTLDYEAECKRLSMIIMKQREMIIALKKACFGMANALNQYED